MDRLQSAFNQPVVRDAVCRFLKDYVSKPSLVRSLPHDDLRLRFELDAHVLPALGELSGVTVEDLLDVFTHVIGNVVSSGIEQAAGLYPRFADAVCDLADQSWRSNSIPVGPAARFIWARRIDDMPPDWQSADGRFSISFVGELPAGAAKPEASDWQMYAQMRGQCSRRFFDVFCSEAIASLSGLLRCVVNLAEEVVRELARQCLDAGRCGDDAPKLVVSAYEKVLDISGAKAVAMLSDEGDWEPETEISYDSLSFIVDCIAALFGEVPKKKDSIARRIKNATRLMIESFKGATGLALSFQTVCVHAATCQGSVFRVSRYG